MCIRRDTSRRPGVCLPQSSVPSRHEGGWWQRRRLLHPQTGRMARALPIHLGLRARQPPAPRCARPFLTVAKSSCHAGDTLLQAPGAISPDRAKASTIHSPAMQHFLMPWQGHHRRLETSPSAVPTTRCAHPAPGRPPSHRVAASLLTAVPEQPRCLCQTHTAHARAAGVTIPTPAPGAPRSPHLPWARVAASPPPADPPGRPPRAPGTAPPATPPAPRPRPGAPLPPALRRARPAAAATSILGSPRPRFTNAASAGRRRRRGGRLRPPGDTASFT